MQKIFQLLRKIFNFLKINKIKSSIENESNIKVSKLAIEKEIDKIYIESNKVFEFIKSNINSSATYQEVVNKPIDDTSLAKLKEILDTHLLHLDEDEKNISSLTITNKDEIASMEKNIIQLENEKNTLANKYELSKNDSEKILLEKLTEVFQIIESNIKNFTLQFVDDNFVLHTFSQDLKKDKLEFSSPKKTKSFLSQLESQIKQFYQADIENLQQQLEEQFNITSKLSIEDFSFKKNTAKTNIEKESYDRVADGVMNSIANVVSFGNWGRETVTETVREYFVNREDIEKQIAQFVTEFDNPIKLFKAQIVDETKNRLDADLNYKLNELHDQIDNLTEQIKANLKKLEMLEEKTRFNKRYRELVARLHKRVITVENISQGIKSEQKI